MDEERKRLPQVLHDIERGPAWKGKFTFSARTWDDMHAPVPMDAHLSPQKAVDLGLGLPSDADLVVVLLWQRMGTPMDSPRRPDGSAYLSGTEYEFEQALAAPDGPPVLLYRRLDEPTTQQPAEQRERVRAFFDRIGAQTASTGYRGAAAFAERFAQDLQALLRRWDDSAAGGPPLERQTFELERLSRLNFRSRSVALLGREAEWAALERFAAGDQPLRWWVVAGAGGAGKSRIALELVLSLGRRRVASNRLPWRAGFLPREHGFDLWHDWRPDRPTLIVIDYVASRADEVHAILFALAQRSSRYEAPLRVLLLERDGYERADWFKKVLGSGSESIAMRRTLHGAALELTPLQDEALVALVRGQVVALAAREDEAGVAGEAAAEALHDDAVLIQRLTKVDPERRPLLALLAAESIVRGAPGRNWTRQELFEDWLGRERERYWRPANVTERDTQLVALATMVGGLKLGTFATLDGGELLPTTRPGPDRYNAQRIQAVNGRPAQEVVWPLAPDLLGEYFVLQELAPHDALDDRGARLWREAVRLSPMRAFTFIEQCTGDHPGHPTLRTVGFPILEDATERLFSWTDFFFRNSQMLDQLGAEFVTDHLEQLLEAARAHPDEAAAFGLLLVAVQDLVKDLGRRGELDVAARVHESMLELEARLPIGAGSADGMDDFIAADNDGAGRWTCAAERAYTLLTFHCFAADVDRAQSFLLPLKRWAASERRDTEVQGHAAAGAANIVAVLAARGDFERALVTLRWLAQHLGHHPGIGRGDHLPLLRSAPHRASAPDAQALAQTDQPGESEGPLNDPVAELLRGARSVAVQAVRAGADAPAEEVLSLLDEVRRQRAADERLTLGWRHLLWELAVNYQHNRQRNDAAASLLQRWLESVVCQPLHPIAEFGDGLETAGKLSTALLEGTDGNAPPNAGLTALSMLRPAVAALASYRFDPSSSSTSLGTALFHIGYALYLLALHQLPGGPDEKAMSQPLGELLDAASDVLATLPQLEAADAWDVCEVFGAAHWARLAARRDGAEGFEVACSRFERTVGHLHHQSAGGTKGPLPSGMAMWAFELLLAADEHGRRDRAVAVAAASREALLSAEVLAKIEGTYGGFDRDAVNALLARA